MTKRYITFKLECKKHNVSIILSLNDVLNLEIKSPAALKHFSASTDDGGKDFKAQCNFWTVI